MYKYFKNVTPKSADFYVYGAIVDEKEPDWFTGEISKTDVDVNDMKNELDELVNKGITDFNIYINSPGGSVFAASTIVSMLRRFKQQTKSKIHSYIDGLCASAATYLLMVADDVNIYQNSIMMIHKPMGLAWGNANELQREIDVLNTIENDMMIPMYMNKSKISEEEIKQLVNDETWFNGNENDELYIGNYFEVNYLEDVKEVVACTSQELFKNYKHVPNKLKEQPKVANEDEKEKEEEVSNVQKPDYSAFEEVIKTLRKGD